jgi:hypothetical protein
VGIGAVCLGAGCAQNKNTIAQLEPYSGKRPSPLAELPPPPPPRAAPRGPRLAGPAGDWLPPGGIANRWQCIVIHHSDSDKSTPQGMRDWHVRGRGWDALGYHFVIGNGVGYPDGKVYVGERWSRQMTGAHCKTPGNHYNEHGIGICLIGDLDAHAPTRRQVQALARLASFLSDRCNIPPSRILTHGGVTHKTRCPGRYFDLGVVIRQLGAVSLLAADDPEP